MSGIGQWFSDQWSKVTGKTLDQTAAPIQKALPSGPDVGTAAEVGGYTSAGGRRHRKRSGKTRKMKKGSRKTRKH